MITTALRGAAIIGVATLVEALRKKLLLVGLAFALALVVLSVAAASVSIGEQTRLIVDVGLAASSGFGSIIALALTISSFAQAMRNRTAYPQLARPVPRWAFVLGKYLGNTLAMMLVVVVMVSATGLVVWLYGDPVPAAVWGSLWMTCVELAVVTAVAILFSTMTTPVLAATFTVGVVLAGNLASEIAGIADSLLERGRLGFGQALRNVYYFLPDLQDFSLRAQASNDLPIPADFMLHGTLYGLAYIVFVLAGAMWIFTQREML